MMKKICFGILVVAFAMGSVLLISETGRAETINLKFAHFMSPKHIQHQKSFAPFSKKVDELTGGKVKIKIFPGGALGRPKQLPDAVKTGITDIAFIVPAFTTGRFPRVSAVDLPFLAESCIHGTKVLYDLWDKHFAADFKDYKVLWLYNAPVGHFMTIDKPIHKMEDVKGLKMRTPSAYMSKFLKQLGANPIGMPITKLTMSLQKKVVDGMLTAISAVQDFRLYDLIGHITISNIYITPMAVVMNKEKWNALPDYAKKAIDQASGKQWGLHAAQVYDEHDRNTMREIERRGKIKVYNMPFSERKRIAEKVAGITEVWVNDNKKRNIPANQILGDVYESFKKNM